MDGMRTSSLYNFFYEGDVMNLHTHQDTPLSGKSIALRVIGASLILLNAALLVGCAGGGGEGGPAALASASGSPGTTTSVTSSGSSATLTWDPVSDTSVIGYYVHYGTTSPGQAGSCVYQTSQYVTSTSATLTGLSPNTQYYFAVSAYNGIEGPCSTEVSTTI